MESAKQKYMSEVRRARAFIWAGKVSFTGAFLFVACSFAAMIISYKKF